MVSARSQRGVAVLLVALALVLLLPRVVAPIGHEAAHLDASVAALRSGRAVLLPSFATPGSTLLAAIGQVLSVVPGRGVRVLAYVALVALGPFAAFAFAREDTRPGALVLGAACLASSWFGAVLFDFDESAGAELFAHVALLGAIAVGSRRRRGRLWSLAIAAALAFALATSPRVFVIVPVVHRVVVARSDRVAARRVVGAALLAAALGYAVFSRLPGAGVLGSLALAPSRVFALAIVDTLLRFRPTAALVAVPALYLLARDQTNEPSRGPLLAYLFCTVALALVPFAGGGARDEALVPTLVVLAAVTARSCELRLRAGALVVGVVAFAVVGLSATATDADSKSRGNRPTRRYVERAKSLAAAFRAHDDEVLLAAYGSERTAFWPAEARSIGRFLAAADRGETLRVLPYAPEMYAYSGRYPRSGALFATSEEAAREEGAQWIVAPRGTAAIPGYAMRAAFPHYVVLERSRD